jgi:hypothetical protein
VTIAIFNGLRNQQAARWFDNERACGVVVAWMRQGVGFGEITIALDKSTGAWHCDTETMGPDFCADVFAALRDAAPGVAVTREEPQARPDDGETR